ncbi:hypothetical protein PB1_07397 [Bacillus methanolicus PB1]|uniref:Uncharacterized protein n=1 Tax=Bacillus methanolicus PB1 TaxID=997296 RepID=I3E0Z6_BACMT|nr:hypothetical protein PB1_07397 [Bacillus methanolicus PB1]
MVKYPAYPAKFYKKFPLLKKATGIRPAALIQNYSPATNGNNAI